MHGGISKLAGDIYRDRVARARQRPIAQKLIDGAELFEYASGITKAGIRAQQPDWSDGQVLAELRRRLDLGRRLELLSAKRAV